MKLAPRSLEVGPEPRASCVSFESHFPIQEAAVLLNETGAESLGHLTIRLSCPAPHWGGAGENFGKFLCRFQKEQPRQLEPTVRQHYGPLERTPTELQVDETHQRHSEREDGPGLKGKERGPVSSALTPELADPVHSPTRSDRAQNQT